MDQENPPPRALLMLPGVKPSAIALIARLLGTSGHVVPQPGLLLLVLPPGADPGPLTEQLSRGFKGKSDVLQVRMDGGYLAVERWRDGVLVETPPAGLIAQSLPDEVPLVLSGHKDPATLPGAKPFGSARSSGATSSGTKPPGSAGPGPLKRLFGRG